MLKKKWPGKHERWSSDAFRMLDELGQFIARDNPRRASVVLERRLEKADDPASFADSRESLQRFSDRTPRNTGWIVPDRQQRDSWESDDASVFLEKCSCSGEKKDAFCFPGLCAY